MVKKLMYIFTFLVWTGIISSCQDEVIVQGSDYIPEGEATIDATVNFKPFGSALNGDSRTAGNAIKDIEKLYIVLFDEKGEHLETFDASSQTGYEYVKSESREDVGAGEGEHIAENATPCVTFKKTLPYGQYKIYAVANHKLDLEKTYTIEELRNIELAWDSSDVKKNNQMFGYFTSEKSNSKPNGWEAPVITIASPIVSLHAWIRRAASKVTIAYDGSKLNENVYIYIHSVQIKDIPKSCLLGTDNRPTTKEQLQDGEFISYAEGSDVTRGISITRGNSTGGSDHSEVADALFFYENVQGVHTDKEKGQQDNNDNSIPDDKDNNIDKDGVDCGSYIEVKGYYKNNNKTDLSQGSITYRFMLGKDVETDYNAERNYHYKLTMIFKNDANNPDWHIEYDEEPGIIVPDPYYISYSYNEKFMIPVKINGGILVGNLVAEINSEDSQNSWNKHNWVPIGGTKSNYTYTQNANYVTTRSGDYFDETKVLNSGVWNGFLTLSEPQTTIVDAPSNDLQTIYAYNKTYWEKNSENAKRTYEPRTEIGSETVAKDNGNYVRTMSSTGTQSFEIPVYTREKTLVTQTGYSGMNIYTSFTREAVVKLTATIKDDEGNEAEYVKYVTIVQAKRLVNPAGIWRQHDNATPFEVTVMEEMNNTTFQPLSSIGGPWRASVEYGSDWVNLSVTQGTNNVVAERTVDGKTIITGSTDSEIRFTYAPMGTIDKNSARCGIIKVEYNNYDCVHRIFVRQGYAPIQVGSGKAKWHSFNMYKSNEETQTPIEEGTFFKFANWAKGIYAVNNETYPFNFSPLTSTLKLIETDDVWSNLTPKRGESHATYVNGFVAPTLNNKTIRVTRLSDWNSLRESCNFGFGVLYADGATTTATTVADAYGYVRTDGKTSSKGMRGCFVYDDQGRNLFFPVGATGYGRRANSLHVAGTDVNRGGALKYATMSRLMRQNDWVQYRPMLYDLMFSEGAIYWLEKEEKSNNVTHSAWDINYRTLDFNTFSSNGWPTSGNTIYESDACFVRCVED